MLGSRSGGWRSLSAGVPAPVVVVSIVAAFISVGCATTGATLGSGVGDTYLEHPPFYAGMGDRGVTGLTTGYLPVVYQRGASQPAIFDPALSDDLQALLEEMTRSLEGLGVGLRLVEGGKVSAVTHQATLHPPDVHFGCATDSGQPDDDCSEREGALGRGSQPMRLAVGRPSAAWTTWVAGLMDEAQVDRVLVVTVEVGQYWIRQRGLRGTKEIELGTGHTVRLPWLTSLEGPVSVLQITGALVGPDGKATRIGAEGILARRTPFRASVLGAQALVTDAEIAEVRSARLEDLPGRPLVWEEALRALTEGLLGGR